MKYVTRPWFVCVGSFALSGILACAPPPSTSPPPDDSESGQVEEEVEYTGPAQDGEIPSPPLPPTEQPTYGPAEGDVIVVDNTCCTVSFSIDDATASETGAVLRGNRPPLNSATGVALSHDGNKWTATACVPINQSVEYYFEFMPGPELRYNHALPIVDYGDEGIVNLLSAMASCQ